MLFNLFKLAKIIAVKLKLVKSSHVRIEYQQPELFEKSLALQLKFLQNNIQCELHFDSKIK